MTLKRFLLYVALVVGILTLYALLALFGPIDLV